jgi:hypothetical protein
VVTFAHLPLYPPEKEPPVKDGEFWDTVSKQAPLPPFISQSPSHIIHHFTTLKLKWIGEVTSQSIKIRECRAYPKATS